MSLIKSIGSKKVNLDFNKNFITIFSKKITLGDLKFINQTLKDLHPSDVANLIENLSYETRVKLIEIESFNIAPEIFIELNESIQSEVLQLLSIDSISNIRLILSVKTSSPTVALIDLYSSLTVIWSISSKINLIVSIEYFSPLTLEKIFNKGSKFFLSKSSGRVNDRSLKNTFWFALMLNISSNSLLLINFAKEDLTSTL